VQLMKAFSAVLKQFALIGAPLTAALFLFGSDQTATIVDSGSTNTTGFRIVVQRSGKAACVITPAKFARRADEKSSTKQQQLSHALVNRLFSDLEAVRPLSSIPEPRCMKSASFGTTRTIEFGGEKTPDLGCGSGGNAKLQVLIEDGNEIVKLFATN
jgi:hypothetical protein